jgi:hypothetical protein
MNFELLLLRINILRKRFHPLTKNKVKTRFLIDATENKSQQQRTLEEILPSTVDFTVKITTGKITVKPYRIIDHKEVYISTQKKTGLFFSCMLWTNSKNIISILEENFEKAWNAPSVITIHPTMNSNKKEATSLQ